MVFCWAVSWLLVKLRVVEVQEMPLETYTRYALCIAADLCHGSAALPKDSFRDAPTSWHANEPERSAQCGQQSASTSGPYCTAAARNHTIQCCGCVPGRCVVPIGVLFAITLWMGNAAYLHLSVSFIQMIKVCTQAAAAAVATPVAAAGSTSTGAPADPKEQHQLRQRAAAGAPSTYVQKQCSRSDATLVG
jgi:hypothetical protein